MKNINERDQSKGYIPLRLIIRDNMKNNTDLLININPKSMFSEIWVIL